MEDLSNFAAFDLDDLLAEISSKQTTNKEVTAYLDREFIVNSINNYREEAATNKQEFTVNTQIDFTDYNFTGADLRGIKRQDLELFNFTDCDISSAHLDRISLEFFREYMLDGKIIAQGLILDNAYLGPAFTRRTELGIECYIYLNLSNLNFSGSSFCFADVEGLILENTNISGCNFTGVTNLDPKQFAFAIGFETAIFSKNKESDAKMKAQVKEYAQTLDPNEYYERNAKKSGTKFISYLANLTNILDD
jgi:uncharacterized protein YjbI with pentapeptide repeats